MISSHCSHCSVSSETGLGLWHWLAGVRVADSKDIHFGITVTTSENEPTVSTEAQKHSLSSVRLLPPAEAATYWKVWHI
jgi:hypothetical protein